nr:immunoglobulin heavy chain junction region [Macaca mulatta]MOV45619.1 immunoglobulin heavy chain junction region [Macaca mulatta]MOV46406.1 immunoglobulin heavy chain junction region [Macaca mulatta]
CARGHFKIWTGYYKRHRYFDLW